jgi:hypothetical protein
LESIFDTINTGQVPLHETEQEVAAVGRVHIHRSDIHRSHRRQLVARASLSPLTASCETQRRDVQERRQRQRQRHSVGTCNRESSMRSAHGKLGSTARKVTSRKQPYPDDGTARLPKRAKGGGGRSDGGGGGIGFLLPCKRRRRRREEESKFNQSEEVSPTRCRVAPARARPLAGERSPPTRGGAYSESYTRGARFLTRWDQHAVAQRRP